MQAKRAALRLLVALVVLGGVYYGLATFLGRHVASNTSVSGIAIGGMSPGEATVTLQRVLASKASRPIHLEAPSRTVDIDPDTAGLAVDLKATLADLSGFTLNPTTLWAHLTEGEDEPLKISVDRTKLTAALTAAARSVDVPVKEGSITFTGGKATAVVSVAGQAVKVEESADAVAAVWPGQQTVAAVMGVTQPKVSADEIARATKEFATPAMSAAVKVVVGRTTVVLQPAQFGAALSVAPDASGTLTPAVDATTLLAAIRAADPGLERKAANATVRLVAGSPQVVPAVTGLAFDDKAVAAPFLAALTSPTRSATLSLVSTPPAVTTAVATGWKIKEQISTFSTNFPANPPRTNNIKIAVGTLNGTIVKPGAQFSLNGVLGERTPAKGYRQAAVIYAGRLTNDYGGGVSQVSTTTFNAAFFSGVRIEAHTPHSFYISRYPEGREATLSWPDVDQKWTNDTGSGILIEARVSGSAITVSFYGTKVWDVEAVKGPRRNVVQPKNIVDASAGCVPQSPTPGFDVTVTRIFKKNGAQVKTSSFNTHYIPEDNVRCTNP